MQLRRKIHIKCIKSSFTEGCKYIRGCHTVGHCAVIGTFLIIMYSNGSTAKQFVMPIFKITQLEQPLFKTLASDNQNWSHLGHVILKIRCNRLGDRLTTVNQNLILFNEERIDLVVTSQESIPPESLLVYSRQAIFNIL